MPTIRIVPPMPRIAIAPPISISPAMAASFLASQQPRKPPMPLLSTIYTKVIPVEVEEDMYHFKVNIDEYINIQQCLQRELKTRERTRHHYWKTEKKADSIPMKLQNKPALILPELII